MANENIREILLTFQAHIDALNSRKSGYQKAFEEEKKKDSLAEPPPELRAFNKQLASYYSEKQRYLKLYPQFEAEFGAKKQGGKKNFTQTSSLSTTRQIHEMERGAKKAGIPPAFKAWAEKQRPQVNQGLRGWEDPAIRRRYEADCQKNGAEGSAPGETS